MSQTLSGNKNVSRMDLARNSGQLKPGSGRDSSLNSTLKRADKGRDLRSSVRFSSRRD